MPPAAIASSSRRPLTPSSSSWNGEQPRDYSPEMLHHMLPSSDDPEPRNRDGDAFTDRPPRNNGLRFPFDRLLITMRE